MEAAVELMEACVIGGGCVVRGGIQGVGCCWWFLILFFVACRCCLDFRCCASSSWLLSVNAAGGRCWLIVFVDFVYPVAVACYESGVLSLLKAIIVFPDAQGLVVGGDCSLLLLLLVVVVACCRCCALVFACGCCLMLFFIFFSEKVLFLFVVVVVVVVSSGWLSCFLLSWQVWLLLLMLRLLLGAERDGSKGMDKTAHNAALVPATAVVVALVVFRFVVLLLVGCYCWWS